MHELTKLAHSRVNTAPLPCAISRHSPHRAHGPGLSPPTRVEVAPPPCPSRCVSKSQKQVSSSSNTLIAFHPAIACCRDAPRGTDDCARAPPNVTKNSHALTGHEMCGAHAPLTRAAGGNPRLQPTSSTQPAASSAVSIWRSVRRLLAAGRAALSVELDLCDVSKHPTHCLLGFQNRQSHRGE